MRIATIAVVATALAACDGRPQPLPHGGADELTLSRNEPHVAEFDLRGGIREEPESSMFATLPEPSFADLVSEVSRLGPADKARAVFVRLGSASLAMAQADELGRLFERLRSPERPVVCHADGYGNATLLFAARACSEIWLSRAGSVESIGLAAQLMFGRELFDKLGIQVDFLQEGRFKGASEPFARNEPSDEARESVATTLAAISASWSDGIAQGRRKSATELGLEDGPHLAPHALELGLVDAIGIERDAQLRARELAMGAPRAAYFGAGVDGPTGLGAVLRALGGTAAPRVPHVAIVRATGAVTMAGGSALGGGEGISLRRLGPILRRLADDPLTQAVVLRIDSPGGSALASDLLWLELSDLRAKKPVVASIGGMAASGGYYLASACNKIVAEKTSIVGSIGVVMGKLSIAESLARFGVHVSVVAPREGGGTRALYGSPFVAWDDATRERLRSTTKEIYDLFVERVAEGRGSSATELADALEGRIMSGDVGLARGLVDEVGGLTHAIELAASLSGLGEGAHTVVVSPPAGLLGLLGAERADASGQAPSIERASVHRAVELAASELLPLGDEVRSFASAFAPIVQGERVVLTLPFALSLR